MFLPRRDLSLIKQNTPEPHDLFFWELGDMWELPQEGLSTLDLEAGSGFNLDFGACKETAPTVEIGFWGAPCHSGL